MTILTKEELADACAGIDPEKLVEIIEGTLRLISLDYLFAFDRVENLFEEINSKEWNDGRER